MGSRQGWVVAAAVLSLAACAPLPPSAPPPGSPEDPRPRLIFPVRLPQCRAGVCTKDLVPLLAQVEHLRGVDRALINKEGTLLLVFLTPGSNPQEPSRKIPEIFPGTRPLPKAEADRALASESWGTPGCGLTEWLQVQNDPGPWVSAFCLVNGYNAHTAKRLGALACDEWNRILSESTDRNRPAHVAQLADRLPRRCADVLSVNQREKLRQAILRWPAFTLARHIQL